MWKLLHANVSLKWLNPPKNRRKKSKRKIKNKNRKRGAAAGPATLKANGEGMGVDNAEDKSPLHVFLTREAHAQHELS